MPPRPHSASSICQESPHITPKAQIMSSMGLCVHLVQWNKSQSTLKSTKAAWIVQQETDFLTHTWLTWRRWAPPPLRLLMCTQHNRQTDPNVTKNTLNSPDRDYRSASRCAPVAKQSFTRRKAVELRSCSDGSQRLRRAITKSSPISLFLQETVRTLWDCIRTGLSGLFILSSFTTVYKDMKRSWKCTSRGQSN